MENIVLTIHLILALALIFAVLLQRSEGGGLGIGGGGGAMTGRAPVSGIQKLTWGIAIGFLVTSISLVIIATSNATSDSVIDRVGVGESSAETPALPTLPAPTGDLTPSVPTDTPAVPPAAD